MQTYFKLHNSKAMHNHLSQYKEERWILNIKYLNICSKSIVKALFLPQTLQWSHHSNQKLKILGFKVLLTQL